VPPPDGEVAVAEAAGEGADRDVGGRLVEGSGGSSERRAAPAKACSGAGEGDGRRGLMRLRAVVRITIGTKGLNRLDLIIFQVIHMVHWTLF
jgi:hypothetical protein